MSLLRLSTELVLWTSALAGAAIILMLGSIFGRRLMRQRHFRARDEARAQLEPVIRSLLSEVEHPLQQPLSELERDVLKTVLLGALEGNPRHWKSIVGFFERYGFIDRELERLQARNPWERAQAAMTLGRMRSLEAQVGLVDALDDPASDVCLATVRSLALLGSPRAAQPLIELLLRGAEGMPHSAMIPALVSCCRESPDLLVHVLRTATENPARVAAASALAEIATPMIRGDLEPFLHDADPEVRARIATAIGRLRDWAALNSLVALVDDPVWFVRLRAVQALGEIGDWRALPALLKAVQDEHWQVRSQVAQVLGRHGWLASSVIDAVERSGDRYAWQALISEFERAGLVWRAIGQLCAEASGQRSEAQAVVASAIRLGALRAAVHAVETHPDPGIALEVARLLCAHARAEDRPVLEVLARTPGVPAAARRLLVEGTTLPAADETVAIERK